MLHLSLIIVHMFIRLPHTWVRKYMWWFNRLTHVHTCKYMYVYILLQNTLVTGDRHTVARTLTVLASLLKHKWRERVSTNAVNKHSPVGVRSKKHRTKLCMYVFSSGALIFIKGAVSRFCHGSALNHTCIDNKIMQRLLHYSHVILWLCGLLTCSFKSGMDTEQVWQQQVSTYVYQREYVVQT